MNRIPALLFLVVFPYLVQAQNVVLSGTISDAKTGETLLSANIYAISAQKGSVSNNYGFYSLILPRGTTKIVCSYMGYQSQEVELNLTANQTLHFQLQPVIELNEVVIMDKSPQQNVQNTQMSMVELPVIQVKQLPVLLGEADIIKTLQLMPGVQSGTEGSSGIYVRGGGPDQNLILLDGVPVYNVNHLFGFFSVFNADAIKSASLTKGGFPARYGGRLSSVIDVRMKDGNMKEFHSEGSVGLLSSQLTLEGPIIKDRTSFIISGRRSYIDLLTYPAQWLSNHSSNEDGSTYGGMFFYDLNGKINHRINDKNRLYLSVYLGKDKFYMKDSYTYEDSENQTSADFVSKGGLKWGNATTALRWNHLYQSRLFSNMTLTLSDYTFKTYFSNENQIKNGTDSRKEDISFEYYSRIRDYGVQYDFDYQLHYNHYLRFGLKNTLHTFSPGVAVTRENFSSNQSIDTTYGRKNIPANEFNMYVEDEMTLGTRFKVNAGLHFSNFLLTDTSYHSLEPRVSARFLITDDISLKASYVQMIQYINLLTNSTIGLPTDLWVPATRRIYPQNSWQTALGAAWALNNQTEFTLEGFYKKMYHLVEYKEGSSFFDLNTEWEDLVTQGEGESYGMEFLVQKNSGKTTGWIGYTLSWSLRNFDDISFGKTFPYKYDRRHDIAIVASHKFSERFDMGAIWVFGSGTALTLADEYFINFDGAFSFDRNNPTHIPGITNNIGNSGYTGHFETRNSFRVPNYHRLDLGCNFHKQKSRIYRTWSFGVYNVYAHNNPFFIYQTTEYDDAGKAHTVLKQFSLLNFIPYVRWGFKF